MSAPLRLDDISDQRAYERERDELRRQVIELKRIRRVGIGPIVSVVLENRTTIRFQVQEMIRAERIIEDARVQDELDAYNPLIPGPGQLCLTLFLELTSEDLLREWLPKLVGIEQAVLLAIGQGDDTLELRDDVEEAHASQLTRDDVTSSVHYVRVTVPDAARPRLLAERAVLRIDHPAYAHEVELSPETKASIVADW